MKKLLATCALAVLALAPCASVSAVTGEGWDKGRDLSADFSTEVDRADCIWEGVPDVAQYRMADWDNYVGYAENVTFDEAKLIAEQHPEITFFFRTRWNQLVLENEEVDPPIYRVFHKDDVAFFTGEPWWGSAPGGADGYIKHSR